jgi:hypothetical protein
MSFRTRWVEVEVMRQGTYLRIGRWEVWTGR